MRRGTSLWEKQAPAAEFVKPLTPTRAKDIAKSGPPKGVGQSVPLACKQPQRAPGPHHRSLITGLRNFILTQQNRCQKGTLLKGNPGLPGSCPSEHLSATTERCPPNIPWFRSQRTVDVTSLRNRAGPAGTSHRSRSSLRGHASYRPLQQRWLFSFSTVACMISC